MTVDHQVTIVLLFHSDKQSSEYGNNQKILHAKKIKMDAFPKLENVRYFCCFQLEIHWGDVGVNYGLNCVPLNFYVEVLTS